MDRKKIILFNDYKDCCGCSACCNICPQSAISMVEDNTNFTFPMIDYKLCISCGACKKICDFQTSLVSRNKARKVYATKTISAVDLTNAASGGAFIGIAKSFIKAGGVVVGCGLICKDEKLIPEHIIVNNERDLVRLQGSKYVQSSITRVLGKIKKMLSDGSKVLFTGTPCQVAALRSYTGDKFSNLYTIDIICHGVPSAKMFSDYISVVEQRTHGHIVDFKFRDKSVGWGMKGSYTLQKPNGKRVKKTFPAQLSSYFQLFLDGYTYRDSCYNCSYACSDRVGDITIGDYWGIDTAHPDSLLQNGGMFYEKEGVSCIVVNTEKGDELTSFFGNELLLYESDWASVSRKNAQLNSPSIKPSGRDRYMEVYFRDGYKKVDEIYHKSVRWKKPFYLLWNIVPYDIQKKIRKTIRKK